jgi:hypothetical protein
LQGSMAFNDVASTPTSRQLKVGVHPASASKASAE